MCVCVLVCVCVCVGRRMTPAEIFARIDAVQLEDIKVCERVCMHVRVSACAHLLV